MWGHMMEKPGGVPQDYAGSNPFGELLGLEFSRCDAGESTCSLQVGPHLLNPYGMLHGGVLYSMADTGMGGALYSILNQGEQCTTLEITIAYMRPVSSGSLQCLSKVIHKGKRVAFLESEIREGEHLIARASGTFAIIRVDGTLQRDVSPG